MAFDFLSSAAEKLGGAAEKASAVRVPVLMRVVFPGLLAAILLFPLFSDPLPMLLDPEKYWVNLVLGAVAALLLGVLTSALSGGFYRVLEGRSMWPKGILESAIRRQGRSVSRLMAAQAAAEQDSLLYRKLWRGLRAYPTNEKEDPVARRPTLLGNIIEAYEDYPEKRYGMDGVFYWTRIWMAMDKDRKEEIDNAWSLADGFVSLAVLSFLGGTLWIALVLADAIGFTLTRAPAGSWSFAAGAGWVVLGYLFYRMSLPFVRQNGELFKAVFDLYRDKIRKMTEMKPNEADLWDAAWAYFQYGMLRCANCGKYNASSAQICVKCSSSLSDALKQFRTAGKFPLRNP